MDDDELLASLSTEQKFSVEAFSRSCEKLDREQSLELLVSLYRRLLVQDNTYKYFLAQKWGIAGSNVGLASTPSATDNWFSEQLDNSTEECGRFGIPVSLERGGRTPRVALAAYPC